MTLKKFDQLLRRVNPKLRIRRRGYGDIGGIFVGLAGKTGYIARITKGELHLNGHRVSQVDPNNIMQMKDGRIKKRGRKTLINLLRNYRWLTHHHQRSMLLWGYDPKDRR